MLILIYFFSFLYILLLQKLVFPIAICGWCWSVTLNQYQTFSTFCVINCFRSCTHAPDVPYHVHLPSMFYTFIPIYSFFLFPPIEGLPVGVGLTQLCHMIQDTNYYGYIKSLSLFLFYFFFSFKYFFFILSSFFTCAPLNL